MAGRGRPKGPGSSLRSRWLGERLRGLREAAAISTVEVAEFLQRDRSVVGRYETGDYPIRRADVYALLTYYGVEDKKTRETLLELCEDVWRKGWWDPYKKEVTKDFIDLPWLESRTDGLCTYQNMVIHGLLQTRAYAETVIRKAEEGAGEEQIQRWVDLRLGRQAILAGDGALRYTMVIEEPVLHRPIGGAAVMDEQLKYLLDLGERKNIEVRVLPTAHGPHSGHLGSFELFVMPEQFTDVAYVETLGGALFVESPDVDRFEFAWQDVSKAALDPKRSAALIKTILKETK
ncbi:helix-turn-helix domain-containing protein [Glycomyces harbinensis]|uniref:Helix-turn-helix domain-containing protein n=2 Tax=Glycomyces harbinensis TaxID=58114 RepID=A0A1G7BT81_9ACTN|nr:helix-turn-helix transcriptional regulator [Glycomyces harbinensis]SDE30269.1 Helix-turn-helix domain-containing protein [Glycomyces harbinensis]